MNRPLLVIGNKNYSSWSLRPWLLLRHFGVAFDELRLALDTPEFVAEIGKHSPSGKVPALRDGDLQVWDSLAICEYVNERWLDGRGWPADLRQRALARSATAEMHSGFVALRSQLPMNSRRQPDGYRWDAAAQRDIDRIQALWAQLRRATGNGPFLLGDFGIVDAMFAPVAVRFDGYGVVLDDREAAQYQQTLLALPALREWRQAGARETEHVAATDILTRPL